MESRIDGNELPILITKTEVARWLAEFVDEVVIRFAARKHVMIA